MAAEGWAFAYRRSSMRYVAEEAAAKVAKRESWRGDVLGPWDWRTRVIACVKGQVSSTDFRGGNRCQF